MTQFLGFLNSVGKIGEALAVWSDPKRRERVKLLLAIEAAENLIAISEKHGVYASMPEHQVAKYKIHWMKRWTAYKDGQ